MTVQINIPPEFEESFREDQFQEILSKVSLDLIGNSQCGWRERATVKMLQSSFKESKVIIKESE